MCRVCVYMLLRNDPIAVNSTIQLWHANVNGMIIIEFDTTVYLENNISLQTLFRALQTGWTIRKKTSYYDYFDRCCDMRRLYREKWSSFFNFIFTEKKKYKNDCVTFAGVYTKYKCSLYPHVWRIWLVGWDVSVSPKCFISIYLLNQLEALT